MESKWETRIAALLRKAESTRSESEREACLEKAEELMVKWGIDRAVVEARNLAEGRVDLKVVSQVMTFPGTSGQTRKDQMSLASNILWALGNIERIRTPRFDQSKGRYVEDLTIVGFESDLESAMMLYSSLRIQLIQGQTTFWKNEVMKDQGCKDFPAHVRSRMKSSYAMGFGNTVAMRLHAIRMREWDNTKGTGTDLVLVDRGSIVRTKYQEMFPNATPGKTRERRVVSHAYGSGSRDGELADLGQKRFSGGRTAING